MDNDVFYNWVIVFHGIIATEYFFLYRPIYIGYKANNQMTIKMKLFLTTHVLALLIVACKCKEKDHFEAKIRLAVDGLYNMICRDPIQVFENIQSLLLRGNKYDSKYISIREPCYGEGSECQEVPLMDIVPYQKVEVYKCVATSGFCPTVKPSKCVSLPKTERMRTIIFLLNNGTLISTKIKEDTICRCECEC